MIEPKDMSIVSQYIYKDAVMYVKIKNNKHGNDVLVYIPSKFTIRKDYSIPSYGLEYVDVRLDNQSVAIDFGEVDEDTTQDEYEQISFEESDVAIREKLERNYERPVSLKGNHEDRMEIRDIFRQLGRLKHTVASVPYKLCISYKHFLCTLSRHNELEGYVIKNCDMRQSKKNMIITTDFQYFCNNLDSVGFEVTDVLQSIFRILDNNHTRNLREISRLDSFSVRLKTLYIKYENAIASLNDNLQKAQERFDNIRDREDELIQEVMTLRQRNTLSDNDKTRKMDACKKKIENLFQKKNEIMITMNELLERKEDLTLSTDRIIFDNTIMITSIAQNLEAFNKILSKKK